MTERTLAQRSLEFANGLGWEFYSTNEFPRLMAAFTRSILEEEARILEVQADALRAAADACELSLAVAMRGNASVIDELARSMRTRHGLKGVTKR